MLSTTIIVSIILLPLLKLCNAINTAESSKSLAYIQAKDALPTNDSYANSYFNSELKGQVTYAFGYEIIDKSTANEQFREEQRYVNGTIGGSYGYLRPDGLITVTHYQADKQLGYQTQVRTFEPDKVQGSTWHVRWPDILKERLSNGAERENSDRFDVVAEGRMANDTKREDDKSTVESAEGEDKDRPDLVPLRPIVDDIVNGRVPLQLRTNSNVVGYETVENVLPESFPIVNFELPDSVNKDQNQNESRKVSRGDDKEAREINSERSMLKETTDPRRDSSHMKEVEEDSAEGGGKERPQLNETTTRTADSKALFTNGVPQRVSDVIINSNLM